MVFVTRPTEVSRHRWVSFVSRGAALALVTLVTGWAIATDDLAVFYVALARAVSGRI